MFFITMQNLKVKDICGQPQLQIEIFKDSRFGAIRVAGTSDEPLFCLADICRAVDLTNPSSVKSRLEPEDTQLIDLHALNPSVTMIGNTNATFVTETGFYEVLLFSNSPKVKPFRRWITKEILPTIRKAGQYAIMNKVPHTFAEALRLAAEQQEKIEAQQKLIEVQNPKVDFYDDVVESKDAMSMDRVAKTLNMGIGRNKLFELLRNKKILMNNNTPYQRYVDNGWFRCIESKFSKPNGDVCINVKTVVLQKGVDAIRRIVKDFYKG